MLAHHENHKPVGRAFTLIEVLIVLALLIGVSAVVLPRLIDRGLGDVLDDTRLRLDAAMLDAQREARRSGQTVEVSLRTDPAQNTTEILIQTMLADATTTPDEASTAPADRGEWWGADDAAQFGVTDRVAPPTSGARGESETGGVLVYVMPDGTIVPAESKFVLQLDDESYDLTVDAGTGRTSFAISSDDPFDDTLDEGADDAFGAADESSDAAPASDNDDLDSADGWSP